MLVVLGIALFFNLGYQLENSFATYYFKYVAGSTNGALFSVYTGVAGIAQMVTLALFPSVSAKIGRGVAYLIAALSQVGGFALLLVSGYAFPANTLMVGVSSAIINIGIGFMLVLVTVSLADVVDYGEYKFNTRNESIIFSTQTFVVKLAGALSGFISGIGLQIIGYVADKQQSETTIMGMRVLMLVIPSIFAVITYLIYKFGYKLKGEFFEEVKRAIGNNNEE